MARRRELPNKLFEESIFGPKLEKKPLDCGNTVGGQVSFLVCRRAVEMEEPRTEQAENFQIEVSEGKEGQSQSQGQDAAEIPPEFLIKHPLQNAWTLWYFDPVKSADWKANQKEIVSFDTIEDFWSVYNYTKLASELRSGADYSLFKKGIFPMWEDPANQKGGRWLFGFEKKQRVGDLDRLWLEVCLCLIGEAFEHEDDICGAVISIRPKQFKICVWTGDYLRQPAIMEIGSKLKDRLKFRSQIVYQSHDDAATKSGSNIKKTYTL